MKPEISKSMLYFEHMKDVSNDLKKWYLHGDKIRVAALYQDISNFEQGEFKVSE